MYSRGTWLQILKSPNKASQVLRSLYPLTVTVSVSVSVYLSPRPPPHSWILLFLTSYPLGILLSLLDHFPTPNFRSHTGPLPTACLLIPAHSSRARHRLHFILKAILDSLCSRFLYSPWASCISAPITALIAIYLVPLLYRKSYEKRTNFAFSLFYLRYQTQCSMDNCSLKDFILE